MSQQQQTQKEADTPLETRLQDAIHLAKKSNQKVAELREDLQKERERNDELEARLEALEDGQDFMREVYKKAADDVTHRAILLIRKLNNQAEANRRRNQKPVAQMTISEAQKELDRDNIDVRRETLYYTFDTADDLVDGDVVEYKKESRASQKKSRLIIDLTQADMPDRIDGYEINPQPAEARGV